MKLLASILTIALALEAASSFQQQLAPTRQAAVQPSRVASNHLVANPRVSTMTATTTSLSAIPFSTIANQVVAPFSVSVVKKTMLAMAMSLVVIFRRHILWPGSGPDKAFPENPLPAGSNGCPFMGSNFYSGSAKYGPSDMFSKGLFQKLGRPTLYRFYCFGMSLVSVTGKKAIEDVLKTEFPKSGTGGMGTSDIAKAFPNYKDIFGSDSVLYENERNRHAMLRRLVGAAMTPVNLVGAVPALESAAKHQIAKLVHAAKTNNVVKMQPICNDFTSDVAWRQILGLNLNGPEEIEQFHKDVRLWMNGLYNPLFLMPVRIPFLHQTKCYKAKERMVELVENKLKDLQVNGPDDSTLSKMYFATDPEDGTTRLTHSELIDNALILIMAGSETSSGTLTNAMLLLGLHKDVLRKLQDEQQALIAKYGGDDTLTKERLDKDCPYLEGFIKETMRIRPIPLMEPRQTQDTILMNGQQIPQKNYVLTNVRATHDQDPSVRKADNDDHMDLTKGFKPERWLNKATIPQEYIPWGVGGRRCLGERLAMTEMKVFLATLVRTIADFDLVGVSSAEEVKWKKMSTIPEPNDGVVIQPKTVV